MTDKQERLLNFILDFHKEYGYSPSIREMAQGMGVSSPSTIKAMLDRLEAKGMLTKSSGRARSLTAVKHEEDKGIPIIGRIVAGVPVMAEENIEGYIPVKEFLRNSNGGFFFIVCKIKAFFLEIMYLFSLAKKYQMVKSVLFVLMEK